MRRLLPLLLTLTASTVFSAVYTGQIEASEPRITRQAASEPLTGQIPPTFVVSVLVSYGWDKSKAEFIASKVPAFEQLNSGILGGFYASCPIEFSWITIKPDDTTSTSRPRVIEHEYHHAWDYYAGDCSIREEALREDFVRVVWYLLSPTLMLAVLNNNVDVVHYNHKVIESIDFNYIRIPKWYTDKWFGYAKPRKQVFIPLAVR